MILKKKDVTTISLNMPNHTSKTDDKVSKLGNKMGSEKTISTMAKQALERGGGRACVATHANGCRHFGILDLRGMDAKTFAYYTKEGEWLYNKLCLTCHIPTVDMCMDKVTKCFLHYCEMGLKGTKYNGNGSCDEKEIFEDHNCNMVLCVECWNNKVMAHEQEVKEKIGVTARRCSARKKFN